MEFAREWHRAESDLRALPEGVRSGTSHVSLVFQLAGEVGWNG